MANYDDIPAIPGMNGLTEYIFEEALTGFWVIGKESVSRACIHIIENYFGEIVGACSLSGRPAVLISYLIKDYSAYPED